MVDNERADLAASRANELVKFPGGNETGSGGDERVDEAGDVASGHALEAVVGEGRPVEVLGRRKPVELTMQPGVVVVAGVGGDGGLGRG